MEQVKWAEYYIEKYNKYLDQKGTSGSAVVGGVEYELYELAQAILLDVLHNK